LKKLRNEELNKGAISRLIQKCYAQFGHHRVVQLLDDLKDLGFEEATSSGASISIADICIPEAKSEFLAEAKGNIDEIEELKKDLENRGVPHYTRK